MQKKSVWYNVSNNIFSKVKKYNCVFCMSIYTHNYVFLLLKICKVSSYLAYTIYLLLFYFKKNYYFIL